MPGTRDTDEIFFFLLFHGMVLKRANEGHEGRPGTGELPGSWCVTR